MVKARGIWPLHMVSVRVTLKDPHEGKLFQLAELEAVYLVAFLVRLPEDGLKFIPTSLQEVA